MPASATECFLGIGDVCPCLSIRLHMRVSEHASMCACMYERRHPYQQNSCAISTMGLQSVQDVASARCRRSRSEQGSSMYALARIVRITHRATRASGSHAEGKGASGV